MDLTNPTAVQVAEAAAKLFAEKGFASTSIREIASAASVTKPTVYYYYGSKEGLIRHLLQGAMDRFMTSVEACENAESLEDALYELSLSHLSFAVERPATVALMARADMMPAGEIDFDLQEARKNSHLAVMNLFARAVERGEVNADPLTMTLSFVGAMVMHLMIRVERPEIPTGTPQESARALVQLFLNGAHTSSAPTDSAPKDPSSASALTGGAPSETP